MRNSQAPLGRSGGPGPAGVNRRSAAARTRRAAAFRPFSYRGVEGVDGVLLRLVRAVPGKRARHVERWLRGREEARKLRLADCVLASHAKSGRTWLRVMLAHYYEQEYGLAPVRVLNFDNLHRQDARIPIVFFTHGNYLRDFTKHDDSKVDFYEKKVLLLARDPRDTAVSLFFQWKYRMASWKKALNDFPPDGSDISLFDFVMAPEYGLPRIVDFLNGWANDAGRLQHLRVIRYEDMRREPARALSDALAFLGTPGRGEGIAETVAFASFDNLKQLEANRAVAFGGGGDVRCLAPGDPHNPDSYKTRRGKVGGYRDYFTDGQVAAIDRLTNATLSPFYGYPATHALGAADAAR
jgi:hypothetical protein